MSSGSCGWVDLDPPWRSAHNRLPLIRSQPAQEIKQGRAAARARATFRRGGSAGSAVRAVPPANVVMSLLLGEPFRTNLLTSCQ